MSIQSRKTCNIIGRFAKLAVSLMIVTIGCSATLTAVGSSLREQTQLPGNIKEGDVIYQVLVDRFEDGDSANNDLGYGDYNPQDLGFYHGGDWKGLTKRLDYIAGLGVNAIWISPVSEQEPLSKDHKEASYHGYFTRNFATPNKHFGSRKDLQTLINQAHRRGLKLILDVVPNHTADYLDARATQYQSNYHPVGVLNNPSFYHHFGDCKFDNTESQEDIEKCDLGGLDDLDQTNPQVSQYLIQTYKDWVDMGFDGMRVDAARSIPKPWLKKFEQEVGIPSFGEIFVGNVDYVAEYQNYEWGALDFPYFFTVRNVFATDSDMRVLSGLFAQDNKYKSPNRLETFIDNHDRARFLTWANDDYQRLRSALSFMMTTRGLPIIYYGTEQADDGNGNGTEIPIANRDNRKDMQSFNTSAPLYKHIQQLTAIRNMHPALKLGKQLEMWSTKDVYAFSRLAKTAKDEVITVAHNAWGEKTLTIPLRKESELPVGSVLTDMMNTRRQVKVMRGGITGKQIQVTLSDHDVAVFTRNTTSVQYIPQHRNVTKIRLKAHVPYGHSLSIRGNVYPLSWEHGRCCRYVGNDLWEFAMERIERGQHFEFKALLDDKQWSLGNNVQAVGGEVITTSVNF